MPESLSVKVVAISRLLQEGGVFVKEIEYFMSTVWDFGFWRLHSVAGAAMLALHSALLVSAQLLLGCALPDRALGYACEHREKVF